MNRNKTSRARLLGARYVWLRGLAISLTVAGMVSGAGAQSPTQPADPAQAITLNFKDADLGQIVDYMSMLTGKIFIVDPRVRAQVTVLSSKPVSTEAAYQAFLSILQVHGFVAVPQGNVIKIVPDANVRQMPANDLPNSVSSTSDEIVTQVIAVRNVNAAQLVPILRPLVPQYGHLAAYPASNMLIISDRAANVNRMMRIIERIDQSGDDQIDIIRLENASAAEIVRVMNSLNTGTPQGGEGGGATAKVVADDRSNSVLLTGEKSQRLRLKALIAHLDTPLENGGDTDVRYLQYADAEDIAKKIKEQSQGLAQAAGGPAAAGGAAAAAQSSRDIMVWADKQTNALIVTAPPKVKKQIMAIVDKLDIRRAQVLVEAILVEMSADKTSELGVNWALYSNDPNNSNVPGAVFNQKVGGTGIFDVANAIQNPTSLTSPPSGLTLGLGRLAGAGTNFGLLLRALRNDGNTNIISTPSILTMDNEEAEVKIAKEVPFITGQYTNASSAGGSTGVVNPFQTIQREEVGTILKITPQINRGDSVMLKISQENSSLAQGVTGAADLITNKRTITTKILIDDGGIIVLGGLIEDNLLEGETRVPILGAIPLLGNLFKTRNVQKTKTNLMLFIRPTILRDGAQAAIETNAKYNVMRDTQTTRNRGKVTLLPGEVQPTLPPIVDLSKYADPTAGAKPPPPGTDATKEPAEKPTPIPDATPEAPQPPRQQPK